MTPTAAILLRAWESGAAVAPPDRAPSLLHSLGAIPAIVRTDELTVGQCDARLFELRRAMFGEMLEMVATCPACRTEVELTLALDELEPPVTAGPVPPLAVQANGYALVCRIPCNEDLRALACRSGEVTLRDLLDRCVLEASSPEGLPAALIFQVHRWMVEAETPLPAAMSASRWSWRSAASTMSVILPGGSLRHREPIFFRWPRSRCPGCSRRRRIAA